MTSRGPFARRAAAFRAAIAPLVAEQDEVAHLIAEATETGFGELLAAESRQGTLPGRARALRKGDDPELAAMREGEPRRRAGGAA